MENNIPPRFTRGGIINGFSVHTQAMRWKKPHIGAQTPISAVWIIFEAGCAPVLSQEQKQCSTFLLDNSLPTDFVCVWWQTCNSCTCTSLHAHSALNIILHPPPAEVFNDGVGHTKWCISGAPLSGAHLQLHQWQQIIAVLPLIMQHDHAYWSCNICCCVINMQQCLNTICLTSVM